MTSMIYTVTLNPALDYTVGLDHMVVGEVNRLSREMLHPGGKGINVSLMLSALGAESRALGFVAGFTGDAIESALRAAGIKTDFVRLDTGFSRINVKIFAETETELNGRGPAVSPAEVEALMRRIDAIRDGDTLVLAGSIPSTLPSDIYERILQRLQGRRVRIVVDAMGQLLQRVLPYRPFLIKPNRGELSDLFGEDLRTTEDMVRAARILRREGARNVLISLAGDGALLLDEHDCIRRIGACRGTVVNSVGAGDSMVAGFLLGCIRTDGSSGPDYAYALRLGTAAGGATAFSDGIATGESVRRLLDEMEDDPFAT